MLRGALLAGVVSLLVIASGCKRDRSALYAARDAGDADAASGQSEGILQYYADLGEGDACLTCLQEECAEAERACLEDADCARQQRCVARCRDPACLLACPGGALGLVSAAFASSVGETPRTCRERACSAECAVGRVFDCVGKFAWGSNGAVGGVSARVLVFDGFSALDPDGATVKYCLGSEASCDDSMAQSLEPSTIESSIVFSEATLDLSGLFNLGFFEVRAPAYEPHLVFPYYDRRSVTPVMFANVNLPEIYTSNFAKFGVEDDPTLGFLTVWAYDCLLNGAPDLAFTVSPEPNPEAFVWYDFPPRPSLERTVESSAISGLGGFALIEEGLYDVRAVHDEEGPVATRPVWIRAGARSWLSLTPRSDSDPL